MSWWQGLDRLRGRFATGGVPNPEQRPAPRVAGGSASPDAWNDVPPLQRTLADPILPVAINRRFRDSLASFSDPSFLAPLSHHVDPSVGGLVDGLVSHGQPRVHGGPELVLPGRASQRAQPRVQRLASWTSSEDDLQTVPLEYRDQAVDEPAEEGGSTNVASPALAVPSRPAPVATHLPVQRAAASVEDQPATAEPALPVAPPEAPASPAPPDTPTLGTGTSPAPLFRLAEPLVAAAPVDHVQRIRYGPVESQQPGRGARNDPAKGLDARVEPAVQRALPRATMTPQPERPSGSLPALDPPRPTYGSQNSSDTTMGAEARGLPDSRVEPAGFESAGARPEIEVSRLAEAVPLVAAIEEPGFIEAPLVVAWNQAAPTTAVEVPSPSGWTSAGPRAARFAEGGVPMSTAGSAPAARVAAPILAVQRRAADPVPSAVRPELPVQTDLADGPAGPVPQAPLVVARSPAAPPPRDASTPVVQAMSFERMFSGAGPSPATTDAAAESDIVQREAVEATTAAMPSVQADAGDNAAPLVTGTPGPAGAEGAAGATGNLDEMARRLYEPLAARLREELWLDRERAGLMNDG